MSGKLLSCLTVERKRPPFAVFGATQSLKEQFWHRHTCHYEPAGTTGFQAHAIAKCVPILQIVCASLLSKDN